MAPKIPAFKLPKPSARTLKIVGGAAGGAGAIGGAGYAGYRMGSHNTAEDLTEDFQQYSDIMQQRNKLTAVHAYRAGARDFANRLRAHLARKKSSQDGQTKTASEQVKVGSALEYKLLRSYFGYDNMEKQAGVSDYVRMLKGKFGRFGRGAAGGARSAAGMIDNGMAAAPASVGTVANGGLVPSQLRQAAGARLGPIALGAAGLGAAGAGLGFAAGRGTQPQPQTQQPQAQQPYPQQQYRQ